VYKKTRTRTFLATKSNIALKASRLCLSVG